MSAVHPSGMAYLVDSTCGVPNAYWVDDPAGEDVVRRCAGIEVGLMIAVYACVALLVLGVSFATGGKVPFWVALVPAVLALLELLTPFFTLQRFRATRLNFESSGLSKPAWVVMANRNANGTMGAEATAAAGASIAAALLSRRT